MDGQVERILGHFEFKSEKFYVIQWKTRFPTFQHLDDLSGCDLLLQQYWEDKAVLELNKIRVETAQRLKTAFENGAGHTSVEPVIPAAPATTTSSDFGGKTEEDYERVDINFSDSIGDDDQNEQTCIIEMNEVESSGETEDLSEIDQTTLTGSCIQIVSTKSLAGPKKCALKRKKNNKAVARKKTETRSPHPTTQLFVRCLLCKKYGHVNGILGHGKSKHKIPDNSCVLCGLTCDSKDEFDVHFETCKRAHRKLRSLLTPDQLMVRGRPPTSRNSSTTVLETSLEEGL